MRKLVKLLRENDYYNDKNGQYFDSVLAKVKYSAKTGQKLSFTRISRLILNPVAYSFSFILIGALSFFLIFRSPSVKPVKTNTEYLKTISYDEAQNLYYENYDIIADAKSGVSDAKLVLYSEILKSLKQKPLYREYLFNIKKKTSSEVLKKKALIYTELLIEEDIG